VVGGGGGRVREGGRGLGVKSHRRPARTSSFCASSRSNSSPVVMLTTAMAKGGERALAAPARASKCRERMEERGWLLPPRQRARALSNAFVSVWRSLCVCVSCVRRALSSSGVVCADADERKECGGCREELSLLRRLAPGLRPVLSRPRARARRTPSPHANALSTHTPLSAPLLYARACVHSGLACTSARARQQTGPTRTACRFVFRSTTRERNDPEPAVPGLQRRRWQQASVSPDAAP
jgi:hypothetical protein